MYTALKPNGSEGFFHAGLVTNKLNEDPSSSFSKALILFQAEATELKVSDIAQILYPINQITSILNCNPNSTNKLCVKANEIKQIIINNNNQQKML